MPLIPKTATEVFGVPYGHCMITVKANGGTVIVEALHDSVNGIWVPCVATVTADGAFPLFPAPETRIRITPSGGATYTLQGPGL